MGVVEMGGHAKLSEHSIRQLQNEMSIARTEAWAATRPRDPWHWHICISGFLQHMGQPSGMMKLSKKMSKFNGPMSRVELKQWNDCWWSVAEWIWLTSNGSGQRVNIYAYSWGAGWGAIKLSQELQARGIEVNNLVMSDPVYRSGWVPDWLVFNPLSLSSYYRPRIVVPDNVQRVWSFRQTAALPRGHELQLGPRTRLCCDRVIETGVVHQYMDDLPEFHHTCLEAAEDLI